MDRQSVIARLDAATTLDTLSSAQKNQAQSLARRLRIGARIFVLGPKSSGKSQLTRALLGIPPSELANGGNSIFCVGDVANDETLSALDLGRLNVKRVFSQTLDQIQIIDVEGAAFEKTYLERLSGVLKQADIVLWCTQSFDAEEAKIWSTGPDALKDRSFLVIAKADILAEQGLLNERVSAMQAVAAEEFYSLHPVSTKAVAKTLQSGRAVSDAQFAASGLQALEAALARLTIAGQRADMDSALLFVERHNIPIQPAEASEPDEPEIANEALTDIAETSSAAAIYKAAYSRIIERAFDLAEVTFDAEDGDMEPVLETCSSIAEELTELLSEGDAHSAVDSAWRGALEEAVDKVTLMGMENDTRSAADAVTILLQLRRDLAYIAAADVPNCLAA